MAMFDNVMEDVSGRFGLGAKTGPLFREVTQLMTGSPGGISGFIDKFRSAGLKSQVSSWLGRTDGAALAAPQVESALGSSTISGIAGRLGLGAGATATAIGYIVPKMIGHLTPGGVIPSGIPSALSSFVGTTTQSQTWRGDQVGPSSMSVIPDAPKFGTEQVSPMAMKAIPEPSSFARWPLLLLAGLAGAGLLWYLVPRHLPAVPTAPRVASNIVTPPAPMAPVTSGTTEVVKTLNQQTINFPNNSAQIPSADRRQLQQSASLIKQLPSGTVIEIDGYTDAAGNQITNAELSQRRADAVRAALTQAGVDPGMLVAKGYGSASPISGNDTLNGRSENRRVVYRATNGT